ncbi:MAG: hypothetical protein IPI31_10150 [Bacteroidetes bacterium]|jgi:hypothetical protein|nr:hypothetical protein [Bacteroidota bacterium]MBK7568170.1 hypothetical protein [Bacteroidota bacterium]
MKKLLLILFAIGSFSVASAQIYGNALGVRFGYGGGISYQHQLNKTNRVEADLGMGLGNSYSYFRLTAAYHWVFDIGTGWNFYVGPAITVGSQFLKNDYLGNGKEGLFIMGGGQLGVEYNWQSLPFQISLDVLPQFAIVNGFDDVAFDPALGFRWIF